MSLARQHQLFADTPDAQKHPHRKKLNQYFTPEFAVGKALSLLPDLRPESIIDPAVGNGIFIQLASQKWNNSQCYGIDIDDKLICGLKQSLSPNRFLFNADSLLPKTWKKLPHLKKVLEAGGFDLVLGNPPFSSWFERIESKEILSHYVLGKIDEKLRNSQGIEILFLELFIRITKADGFITIVLPDGVLANPKYQYVREFILQQTQITHMISLPRHVFHQTSAKTSILILQKKRRPPFTYYASLQELNVNGNLRGEIKVRREFLLTRMDYYYHHGMERNSRRRLKSSNLPFKGLDSLIYDFRTGKTLYGPERKFAKKGLRFLHATNITEIGINYQKDERFIDPSSNMNSPGAKVRVGDIVFVRVGAGCAGRVAIVDAAEDMGIATDYLHILRAQNINPYYLVIYFKTRFGREDINLLKHGVGTVSINKKDVLSLLIPILPEEEQLRIEGHYKKILHDYRKNGESHQLWQRMSNLVHGVEQTISNTSIGGKDVEMPLLSQVLR